MKKITEFESFQINEARLSLEIEHMIVNIISQIRKFIGGDTIFLATKPQTTLMIVTDLSDYVIKDGDVFDDLDRREYKKNRDVIIRKITKELK